MKVEIKDNSIEYKKLFKTIMVPVLDIKNAYMRVEEVNANMCCGRMNFDRCFLMLKTENDIHKIELENDSLVKKLLDEISEKNPDVEIGFNNN